MIPLINQALHFIARYIHDEMYGVDLDLAGNYLLLGGSGDEYSYTATNANGDKSDIWVSYLVVADPQVNIFSMIFKYIHDNLIISNLGKHIVPRSLW